jgi:hypothetical protein
MEPAVTKVIDRVTGSQPARVRVDVPSTVPTRGAAGQPQAANREAREVTK